MRSSALKFLVAIGLLTLALTPQPRPHHKPPVLSYSRPSFSLSGDYSELLNRLNAKALTDARAWIDAAPKARSEGSASSSIVEAVSYEAGSIEAVICSVFGDACAHAIRIARCESGLNPAARNRSGASGLFQLLGHGSLFEAHGWSPEDWADPYKNTVVAFDLYSASGWGPWVCR